MESVKLASAIAACPFFLIAVSVIFLIMGKIKFLRSAEGYAAFLAVLTALFFMRFPTENIHLFDGMAVISGMTAWIWIIVLVSLAGSGFVSIVRQLQHPGSYYFLLFFSAASAMLAAAADNLFFAFAASEVSIIPLYFLVSCRRGKQGLYAAYKLSVFGSFFSAFSMLGLAFLNYSCPSLYFSALSKTGLPDGLAVMGFLLYAFSFSFKVAAAPFNLVYRDVLSGAPGPVAAFIASSWVLCGLPALYKIYSLFYSGPVHDFFPAMAVLSVIAGGISAFYGRSLKRIAVGLLSAGIGFCLLAFSGDKSGLIALIYHLPALAASVAGLFLFSFYFEKEEISLPLSGLAGFAARKPVIAVSATVCLFSAAGLPPFGGFFAKFLILFSLIKSESFFLAAAGMIGLAFSVLCCFKLVSVLFFRQEQPLPEGKAVPRAYVPLAADLCIIILAIFLAAYGIFSNYFIGKISAML